MFFVLFFFFLETNTKYFCISIISGREKATIVAHDWGGIIAWFFVMIYSQMVDSYVIMNAPHPIIFRKFISTSFTQLRMSW